MTKENICEPLEYKTITAMKAGNNLGKKEGKLNKLCFLKAEKIWKRRKLVDSWQWDFTTKRVTSTDKNHKCVCQNTISYIKKLKNTIPNSLLGLINNFSMNVRVTDTSERVRK